MGAWMMVLIQQVPEIHDRRVFEDRSSEHQASKLAHRSDLVQRLFHGWIQRHPNDVKEARIQLGAKPWLQ